MAPIRNASVIYKAIPTTYPIPGEHIVYTEDNTIDLNDVALDGGVLIKVLALSVDPYFRGKMRDPKEKSYSPTFEFGKPLTGFGIGVVLRSENPDVKVGDHVNINNSCPFQEYAVISKSTTLRVLQDEGIPWSKYLGVAGMPGATAWLGYHALVKGKAGQTIYVTTGAGAVGSIVCQLAKKDGLKVIASAGSDDKVKYMKEELGVDVPFNYKTQDVNEVLAEHGPVNFYWDMVGGKSFESAIEHTKTLGKIICVGAAGEYNSKEKYGVKNTNQINRKSLTIQGFIWSGLAEQFGFFDFYTEVPKRVKAGELRMREHVVQGLKEAPQLIFDVLKGNNTGKAVVQVALE